MPTASIPAYKPVSPLSQEAPCREQVPTICQVITRLSTICGLLRHLPALLVSGIDPYTAEVRLPSHWADGLRTLLESLYFKPTLRRQHGARFFWSDLHV